MAFELLVASGIAGVAYVMFNGFKKSPGQIEADPDIFDPSEVSRVTETHPVDSVDSSGVSGKNAQMAPATQKKSSQTSQDDPYQTPVPSGDFAPQGSPYADDTKKTVGYSADWLSKRPATLAINKFNRTQDSHVTNKALAREMAETRASQYIGASTTKSVVSLPIAKRGHIYHSPGSHAALASGKKSHLLNTLDNHTRPPVKYAKTGTGGDHTLIKTGRLSKTTH